MIRVSALRYPLAFPKSLIKHMALTYNLAKLSFYLKRNKKRKKFLKVFKATKNLFDPIHLCCTLSMIYSKLLSILAQGYIMHPYSERKRSWQHRLQKMENCLRYTAVTLLQLTCFIFMPKSEHFWRSRRRSWRMWRVLLQVWERRLQLFF